MMYRLGRRSRFIEVESATHPRD